MKKFQGILAALVTPINERNEVDLGEMKKLVRYLINKGIDGFYVGGTTGEAFLLSQDERKRILEAVVEENNGEKIVIAHVGSISTQFARDLAVHAEKNGADAVSAISPFYYHFSREEIKHYYFDIMDACHLPMFIYNFPNLSGFSLTPDLLDEMCRSHHVAGVKFTSNNFFDMERMKHAHPELTIWNGFDEMLLSGLVAGADGAIGSTYNILSPIAHGVYDAFRAGDLARAQHFQSMINEMITLSKKHDNLKVVKKVLELEGIRAGSCRAPFLPLNESAMDDVRLIREKFTVAP